MTTVTVNPGAVVDTGEGIFPPGDSFDIDEKEAERLIKKGVVSLADSQGANPGKGHEDPEVAAALKAVEGGYTTGDGKPTVDAMKTLLGRDVTSEERDTIWERAQG